jgi:hypothetical protein
MEDEDEEDEDDDEEETEETEEDEALDMEEELASSAKAEGSIRAAMESAVSRETVFFIGS